MDTETGNLAELATAGAAWLALLLSILGISLNWRATRIAEKQEKRRHPLLVAYLQDAFMERNKGRKTRIYTLPVTVSNRSDSGNAIANLELRIVYTGDGGFQRTLVVGSNAGLSDVVSRATASPLVPPVHIDANSMVSGSCFFEVVEEKLHSVLVDRYIVAMIDTHGNETALEPILIREYDDVPEDAVGTSTSARPA